MIGTAEQIDRPLEQRIADYERALGLLKGLEPTAGPADLPAVIQRVERELERLRLKHEFFGK